MRCVSPDAKIAALLHDVVEDTEVTFDDLQAEGFSATVLSALRLLTHAKDVPYEDYVQRVAVNATATEVKLADLEDNMDLRRLGEVDDRAVTRLRRYLAAHKALSALPKT